MDRIGKRAGERVKQGSGFCYARCMVSVFLPRGKNTKTPQDDAEELAAGTLWDGVCISAVPIKPSFPNEHPC